MPPKKNNESKLVIEGYTVLQVKASERSRACNYLYLKEHSSIHTCTEWPHQRTLEVHNVPPYCTQEHLCKMFASCGHVMRVYLQPKATSMPLKASLLPSQEKQPKHTQTAYVVFRKASGVRGATDLPYNKEITLSDGDTKLQAGLRGYIADYRTIPDVTKMEQEAEAFLAEYYKTKAEEVEREKEMEGLPDEDGFIKVTRHGKNKGSKRTEENERKAKEKIRLKKKKVELTDFYTSQYRETKRKHILELQAKFEEDKKKIREMKAARKFRPY